MKEKVAVVSIIVNTFLSCGKITVGIMTSSAAILAEGLHSFMDVFASAIGFIGIVISNKPGDEKHPYGHHKFEVLAGAIITLILLGSGIGIVYGAYQGFINPHKIKIDYLAYLVMLFSSIINEIMARLKIHFGKTENSIALITDGFHSRIDVFISLTVLCGLFFAKYWIYTDSLLALLIGIYIIKKSFSLGKEAVDSLLDVSAGKEIERKITSIAENNGINISSLKTQKKGLAITANLEIILPGDINVENAVKLSNDLRERLIRNIDNLVYVVIQIESNEVSTGYYNPLFGKVFGWRRRGGFKKNAKELSGRGPGGYCACPKCGYKIDHRHGTPCAALTCPHCDTKLERQSRLT